MRLVQLALVTLVTYSSFTHADDERAVIIARQTGVLLSDQKSFVFLPGEVVVVRRSRKGSSLVESDSRSETAGGAWIQNRALAFVRSFTKVEKWAGEKSIDYEAGDYGATYRLYSNGSFRLRAEDGHLRESLILRGHLYRAKNVVWARIKGKNGAFPSQEFVFIVLPNGKLCYPFESCDAAPSQETPRN